MRRITTWLLAIIMAFIMVPSNVFAEGDNPDGTDPETQIVEEMASASIGGLTYFYTDTAEDDPATVYQATVRGRAGSTVYTFAKADLTQVTGTDYYYTTVTGVTPLSGTLYGYTGGTPATYASVYAGLGVETDSSYDVISSATKYAGVHVKDIPSMVTYGTDAEGNKAITGLNLARETETVDATAYVEASILRAAGQPLTDQQTAALAITLKVNPMNAPSEETIKPVLASAEYIADSKYGLGEFDIIPDAAVPGYVWSEYWGNVYAATISDGTNTVGAVHWIDLYGEAATAGPHYNKIQLALNNGVSTASNQANVTRYAAFYDENNTLKSGTYTIRIYAEGYEVLEAKVDVYTPEENQAAAENVKALIEAANGSFATADEALAAVEAAKTAYNALTSDQMDILTDIMPDAEIKIEEAQTAADSQKAQEVAEEEARKKAEEEARKKAEEAAKKAAEAKKVNKGDSYTVFGQTYQVTKAATAKAAGAVTFTKAKNAKSVTIPATVKLKDGKTYDVTQIGAKAFAASKATKVTVKTRKLSKKTVKNSLKGSKVKTVIVKVGKKKENKTYVKNYKKIFTKKIAGKKVTVK